MYFLFDTVHNALKVPGLGDVDGQGKYPRAAIVVPSVLGSRSPSMGLFRLNAAELFDGISNTGEIAEYLVQSLLHHEAGRLTDNSR